MMVDYIDAHRLEFGVESICNELPIAPSTYHDFKQRQPPARAQRDAIMLPIVMALFVANYRVYGACKLWIAAPRAGHDIGRDQVTRLDDDPGHSRRHTTPQTGVDHPLRRFAAFARSRRTQPLGPARAWAGACPEAALTVWTPSMLG